MYKGRHKEVSFLTYGPRAIFGARIQTQAAQWPEQKLCCVPSLTVIIHNYLTVIIQHLKVSATHCYSLTSPSIKRRQYFYFRVSLRHKLVWEGWDFATSLSAPQPHTKHVLLFSLKKLHMVEACLLLQYKTDIFPPFCFLQIFAYMNENSSRKEKWDLQALRFLSINSIIDPWVFAILRPPVLRLVRSVLCGRDSLRTQEATQTSCSTQSNASKQVDLWGWQLRSAS